MAYTAVRIVGYGATSLVFEGLCENTGEKVAIKKTAAPEKDCMRECQIISSLSHPNIIRFRDCFFNKSTKVKDQMILNVVTDLFDADLKHVLVTFTQLGQEIPPLLIKLYSYQMAKALAYLEAKGVVHGDVSVENFLVDYKRQTIALCGFGNACQGGRVLEKLTNKSTKAPELLLTEPKTSHKADIWALGCAIAHLSTHRPLFSQKTKQDLVAAIFSVIGLPSNSEMKQEYGINLDSIKRANPIGLKKVASFFISTWSKMTTLSSTS